MVIETHRHTHSLISPDIHTYMSIYLSAMYLFIRLSITPFYQIYHYPEVEGPDILVDENADCVEVLGPQALDNANEDGHHLHKAHLGRPKEAPQATLKR